MLSFVEGIKQIIAEVQTDGGAAIQHISVSSILLQQLREYAVQRLSLNDGQGQYALVEWFNEGFFDEYVRACIIYLYKLGITEEARVFSLISRVVDLCLTEEYVPIRHTRNFEERLIASLVEIWNQLGDDQTTAYTYARDRWLISWDYQRSQWKVTGLGRFPLELSPVQATTFLLIVDTLFSTGRHDFRHISIEVLREAFSLQPDSAYERDLMPYHEELLFRLGVTKERSEDGHAQVKLTPLGKIVIDRVLSKDNPLRDGAKSLIMSEELGDAFKGSSSEIENVKEIACKHDLVDNANRRSIETAAQLYRDQKFQESLRVIYPSIEAIVNTMLLKISEKPDRFGGLTKKLQWLEQQKLIPADISSAMEVITGRNKVLHGNLTPPDDYVSPLCLLAFRYLRRLLTEYHPDSNIPMR